MVLFENFEGLKLDDFLGFSVIFVKNCFQIQRGRIVFAVYQWTNFRFAVKSGHSQRKVWIEATRWELQSIFLLVFAWRSFLNEVQGKRWQELLRSVHYRKLFEKTSDRRKAMFWPTHLNNGGHRLNDPAGGLNIITPYFPCPVCLKTTPLKRQP